MIPLLLLLVACGAKDVRTYDTSLLHLATGYNAKMVCSCLFVAGQEEEACRDLVRVSPDIARFRVDDEAKSVTSKALGGWRQTARYVDAEQGCRLDAL